MISRLASYVAIALAASFIFAAGWFCLWSISLHLAGGADTLDDLQPVF